MFSSAMRGTVDLSDVMHQPRFSSTTAGTATTLTIQSVGHQQRPLASSVQLLSAFAATFADGGVSTFLSANACRTFASGIPGISRPEANMWSLASDLLDDREKQGSYRADEIGLDSVPTVRRWSVSHQAIIQDLLQRDRALRSKATVLCWLERTYEAHSSALLPWNAHSTSERALLIKRVFEHVRSGKMSRAIEEAGKDCELAVMVTAAQLRTAKEPWFQRTPLVPLFGEYAGGESKDAQWANNATRLAELQALRRVSRGDEAASEEGVRVIAAAFSGEIGVLRKSFRGASWQDLLWCELRCELVLRFTDAIQSYTGKEPPTRDGLNIDLEMLGKEVSDQLREVSSSNSCERIQIGLICTFLPDDEQNLFLKWASTDALQHSHEESRVVAFLMMCLCRAQQDGMLAKPSDTDFVATLVASLKALVRMSVQLQVGHLEDLRSLVAQVLLIMQVVHSSTCSNALNVQEVYSAMLLAARKRGHDLSWKPEAIEAEEVLMMQQIQTNIAAMRGDSAAPASPGKSTGSHHLESLLLKDVQRDDTIIRLNRDIEVEKFWWACQNPQTSASADLKRGVTLCRDLWKKAYDNVLKDPNRVADPDLGALTDAVRIIQNHVLEGSKQLSSSLASPLSVASAGSDQEFYMYWSAVSEVWGLNSEHLARCHAIKSAHPQHQDRTATLLQQGQELQLYDQLQQRVATCLKLFPAAAPQPTSPYHVFQSPSVLVYVVLAFAHCTTFSIAVATSLARPAAQVAVVMRCVERLSGLGVFDMKFKDVEQRSLLELYDAVRGMTSKYNEVLLRLDVEQKLGSVRARR